MKTDQKTPDLIPQAIVDLYRRNLLRLTKNPTFTHRQLSDEHQKALDVLECFFRFSNTDAFLPAFTFQVHFITREFSKIITEQQRITALESTPVYPLSLARLFGVLGG
ncbi:MAG TPA: hypothetical protein DGG95_03235 [Cytophagales bacterium]|jgi:hypothetical protein|nr:hypothetical protein [Cytophagales bacterium]